MAVKASHGSKEKLVQVGIQLFRRKGYVASTVDEICASAGVTKGAFFHHFGSKEELAEESLAEWGRSMAALHESAPYQSKQDPVERLLGCLDFLIAFFEKPKQFNSCLAGTVVQEVSESHPQLRAAAQQCFQQGEAYLQTLLEAACRERHAQCDCQSLARMWGATIQGSLVLQKASRDASLLPNNLRHFQRYVRQLLEFPRLV